MVGQVGCANLLQAADPGLFRPSRCSPFFTIQCNANSAIQNRTFAILKSYWFFRPSRCSAFFTIQCFSAIWFSTIHYDSVYKIFLIYNSAILNKTIILHIVQYNSCRLFRPTQPSPPLATGQQLASVELGEKWRWWWWEVWGRHLERLSDGHLKHFLRQE